MQRWQKWLNWNLKDHSLIVALIKLPWWNILCYLFLYNKKNRQIAFCKNLLWVSEWSNVHFYIRPKPKAEYFKIFGLWPNTEAETECWIFKKLLSICRFNLTFAPFLIKPCKNFNGQHNHFYAFKKIKIFTWFYKKWISIP
jgi:hypothetical protein